MSSVTTEREISVLLHSNLSWVNNLLLCQYLSLCTQTNKIWLYFPPFLAGEERQLAWGVCGGWWSATVCCSLPYGHADSKQALTMVACAWDNTHMNSKHTLVSHNIAPWPIVCQTSPISLAVVTLINPLLLICYRNDGPLPPQHRLLDEKADWVTTDCQTSSYSCINVSLSVNMMSWVL